MPDVNNLTKWLSGPHKSETSPVLNDAADAIKALNEKLDKLAEIARKEPSFVQLLTEQQRSSFTENNEPGRASHQYKSNDVILHASLTEEIENAVNNRFAAGKINKLLEAESISSDIKVAIYQDLFSALAEKPYNKVIFNNELTINADSTNALQPEGPKERIKRAELSPKDYALMAQLAALEANPDKEKKITIKGDDVTLDVDPGKSWSINEAIATLQEKYGSTPDNIDETIQVLRDEIKANKKINPLSEEQGKALHEQEKTLREFEALQALLLYITTKEKLDSLIEGKLRAEEIQRLTESCGKEKTALQNSCAHLPNIFNLMNKGYALISHDPDTQPKLDHVDLHLLADEKTPLWVARDAGGNMLGLFIPERKSLPLMEDAFIEPHVFSRGYLFALEATKYYKNFNVKTDDTQLIATMYVTGAAHGLPVSFSKKTPTKDASRFQENPVDAFNNDVNNNLQQAMKDLCKTYEQMLENGGYADAQEKSFSTLIKGLQKDIEQKKFKNLGNVNDFFDRYHKVAVTVSDAMGVKRSDINLGHQHETDLGKKQENTAQKQNTPTPGTP